MTTATLLTALVGDDGHVYSSTEKSSAITAAQSFLGTSDGDSASFDMATAMMAQAILINNRLGDKAQPLSSLHSPEIRNLMRADERATTVKTVHHRQPTNSARY